MSNERPILFSAPMVRALLDGIKTQTRRVVKKAPQDASGVERQVAAPTCIDLAPGTPFWRFYLDDGPGILSGGFVCPYGVPGDRLWVRETWRWKCPDDPDEAIYRADGYTESQLPAGFKWKPAIHMFRAASRITLEITEVRVQRLQEITPEDAKAEGAPYYVGGHGPVSDTELRVEPGYWHGIEGYRQGFEHLWGEINGWPHEPKARCPWQLNPFVWALTFRRIAP